MEKLKGEQTDLATLGTFKTFYFVVNNRWANFYLQTAEVQKYLTQLCKDHSVSGVKIDFSSAKIAS